MSENDKITYSESRTINIGQYENISTYFSYTGNVKHYNRQDKTVEIAHTESQLLKEDSTDFKDSAKLVMKRVKKVLNRREREIRLASLDYVTDGQLELKAGDVPNEEDCI